MGEFLHIGFVAEATIQLSDEISKDELLAGISDFYAADTFDIVESAEKITFKLNKDVIGEELEPFVRKVYEDYYGNVAGRGILEEVFKFIRENTENPDWLEKVEEANLYDFSSMDYGVYDHFNIGDQSVWLNTTFVILGSEGKFLMEEYSRTLGFMKTCAHQAYSGFKLGKTFRVFVF